MNNQQLNPEVFNIAVDERVLHQVIRWQLSKKRLGSRKTKGISEIRATTRKPYRQKGTGRARQGSLVSPQFRGGAVIFGPVVRDHSFKLNKKYRKLAIKMALSEKSNQGRVVVVQDDFVFNSQNINELVDIRGDASKVLFVGEFGCRPLSEGISNAISVPGLNVYSIICCNYIVISESAMQNIKKRLL